MSSTIMSTKSGSHALSESRSHQNAGPNSSQKIACASRIPNSLAESRIETTLRGAWRLASDNEVRSHASLKGHTPSTFAGGHMVARAELNNVRWVSHCRDLVQLPVAA